MTAIAKDAKQNKFIRLKTIGRSRIDLDAFRGDLFSKLGDRLFYIQSKQELLFNLISHIAPVNKSLQCTDVSIEQACLKIIEHFGFKGVQVKIYNAGEGSELPKPKQQHKQKKTNAEQFLEDVLHIDLLPSQVYHELSTAVNADLHELSELIAWYEGLKPIKKFLSKGEIPSGTQNRRDFDFYQRCIVERGEIVNYQLYGLRKRVLMRVHPHRKLMGAWMAFRDRYDRPYDFARSNMSSYYDSRKINLAQHRLGEFYLDETDSMVSLYNANKTKFYKVYFKRIPWKRLFDDCVKHLSYLPASKDRIPIFNELLSLFKGKRWMSFYALALPQVEGLFYEMCTVINPNGNSSPDGLTKKVLSVREHYFDYHNSLDYYQYHIPIQRNQFAHIGYDEDFQLKSYDLLVDLFYLITVFSELNNPLVKVKRLHADPNVKDFATIEHFSEYFKLLDEVEKLKQKNLVVNKKSFEESFLMVSTDVIKIAEEIIRDFPEVFLEFVESVNVAFSKVKAGFDLRKSNRNEMDSLLKTIDDRNAVLYIFRYSTVQVEDLMNYYHFINGFIKHMSVPHHDLQSELKGLRAKYAKSMDIIQMLLTEVVRMEKMDSE